MRVRSDALWIETVLDDQWVVAYRLVSQPKGLVVAELRVFPVDDTWRNPHSAPGEWSGCLLGTRATAPEGGLTARLLRCITIDKTIRNGGRTIMKTAQRGPLSRSQTRS